MSTKPLESAALGGLYDRDFAVWCDETARLLRAGRLAAIDVEHVAEELEAMAKSDRRQVRSRLRVLILHLLKWEYQPDKRKVGWEKTIATQRAELELVLEDSPSLQPALPESIARAYPGAVEDAVRETRPPADEFPNTCPYTSHQILDSNFLPQARGSR